MLLLWDAVSGVFDGTLQECHVNVGTLSRLDLGINQRRPDSQRSALPIRQPSPFPAQGRKLPFYALTYLPIYLSAQTREVDFSMLSMILPSPDPMLSCQPLFVRCSGNSTLD